MFFPSEGWIDFESADWMPASGDAPKTFLMPQHLTIRRGSTAMGVSHAAFHELHAATFEVLARPERVTRVFEAAAPGEPVAWVATVTSASVEDALLQLAVQDVPDGWRVVLSEVEIPIGRDDASRSVDVHITAVPGEDLPDGAAAQFAVTCSCDETVAGRVVFDVSVVGSP